VDRLAELRESQGLTLRDLAERSGVDANTINQVELGHRKPRPSTLRKLAKALDVEVADFFREPAVPLPEAPRGARLQEGGRPNSARVVASLRDHAQIFRALADRLTSGLEQVRPEELPALVFESVWVVNGASKMMAENVAPLLEDARPEEMEAGQEAERAIMAIESAVYAISVEVELQRDEFERQNRAIAAGGVEELAEWRRKKVG
jgi:transcriptional regulator with XRE-family HTH domain